VTVKIVTDSTSDLPRAVAEELGITVVPLNVHFGMEVFKDQVDLSADEFYRRLVTDEELPKTSQPSIGDFIAAYERIGHDADGIVSVHVSEKVSGTINAARQAAQQADVPCPIEVQDTLQASMGIGMVAIDAATVAAGGADLEQVADAARDAISRCQCFALLDTLEYLHKGGRIGKAQALLGTLLRVKPLIIVTDGEVHQLAKERTRRKAIDRLVRTAREFSPLDRMAVLYSTTRGDAEDMADGLADLMAAGRAPMIAQFGPAIGTYVGPDSVGIGLLRASGGA
jgi:DegV family protein with EDD domain